MKKLTKILLVMCLMFSQFASPIKVIAEQVAPNYDLNVNVVVNASDENLLDVTLTDASTGSTLDTTAGYQYIVSTDLTFNYKNADVESVDKIELIDGTDLLTSYTYDIDRITSYYNGSYDINVKLYEVGTEVISDTSEEGLETYIGEMTPKIDKTVETVLENNGTLNGLELVISGTELTCIQDECVMLDTATDKNVNINMNVYTGDLSKKAVEGSYFKLEINDELVLDSYNIKDSQDFADLLYGDYKYELTLYNKNNEVMFTDSVKVKYGDSENNADLDTYFVLDENGTDEEIYNSIYNMLMSSTVLSDQELANIDIDLELLESIMKKSPIDAAISGMLTDTLGFEVEVNSFSDILGEELTEVIISDEFVGVFEEEEPLFTVGDIIDPINNFGLSATVTDTEGNEVAKEESIGTNMKLNITVEGFTLSYTFAVYGDVDNGYVTDEDVSAAFNHASELELIEDIRKVTLDMNSDGVIDLLDVTYIAATVDVSNWFGFGTNNLVINSSLKQSITNEEIIRVGDTFKIDYVIEGLTSDTENNYINGIEGIIEYDKDSLSIVGISALSPMEEYVSLNTETNKFMSATKGMFDEDGTIITITFKAIAKGETTVKIVEDVAACDGAWVTVENAATIDLNIERALSTNNDINELKPSTGSLNQAFNKDVLEYTLYVNYWVNEISLDGVLGDEYAKTLGFKEYTLNGDRTAIKLDVVAENGDIKSYTINVVKVYPKSSNNNLKSLEIEGYEIEFNKDTLEYEITVKSNVSELDITAKAEDNSARVNIYGNSEFEEGENTVTIVVTAEDGSEKEYKITVNKKAKEVVVEEEETEENNDQLEKTIIIILIILVIIGLLYLIFKKDEEEETPVTKKDNNKK